MARRTLPVELRAIVEGTHTSPHDVLGRHGDVVRIWAPGAAGAEVDGVAAEVLHPAGLFEAPAPAGEGGYGVTLGRDDGSSTAPLEDPYRFLPTIGELDLHLFAEGNHRRLWEVLGARPTVHQDVAGTAFAVWAPAARAVRVVGDWNGWDARSHPMRAIGSSGVWELFVPAVGHGARYKFEVVGADGHVRLKADPYARWTEQPPATASVVFESGHEWDDAEWMQRRARRDTSASQRLSVYECHLGSWARSPDDPDRWLGWDDLAPRLADHVADLGFTHVELLPPMEHPFGGSWGYQVSGYFAPTARHGDPDGFRRFVDHLHQPRHRRAHRLGAGALPEGRLRPRPLRRHRPLRARRPPPGRAPRLGHARLQLRPRPRCATSSSPTPCSGSRSSTSTGSGSTRWPRCSTSTTAGTPASGCPTATAAGRTSRPSTSSASSTPSCTPSTRAC